MICVTRVRYLYDAFHSKCYSPETTKSRNKNFLVQIQIGLNFRFELVPQGSGETEFLVWVDLGAVAFSMESVIFGPRFIVCMFVCVCVSVDESKLSLRVPRCQVCKNMCMKLTEPVHIKKYDKHTYTPEYIPAYTHALPHTLSLSHTQVLTEIGTKVAAILRSLTHTLSLTPSLSLTHTQVLARIVSIIAALLHTLSHTLSHTHTISFTHRCWQ